MSPILPGSVIGPYEFATIGPNGVPAAPDAAPAVDLRVNRATVAAFTVTNSGPGLYDATVTVPLTVPHGAYLQGRFSSVTFSSADPTGVKLKDFGVVDLGGVFEFGQARAGGASAVTLKAGATSAALAFRATVEVVSGPGAGQTARVTAYDATTKVATVDAAWAVQPTSASFYAVRWYSDHAVLPVFAPSGYGGTGGGGGGGPVDLTQSYAGTFDPGTIGSLVQKVASSYGAIRTVVVVDGSMAASRVITVRPAAGEPPLPTAGMVRNPPLTVAVVSGGQAVQKAQIVGWRVAAHGTDVVVTLNQPWPGALAVGDVLIVF